LYGKPLEGAQTIRIRAMLPAKKEYKAHTNELLGTEDGGACYCTVRILFIVGEGLDI